MNCSEHLLFDFFAENVAVLALVVAWVDLVVLNCHLFVLTVGTVDEFLVENFAY